MGRKEEEWIRYKNMKERTKRREDGGGNAEGRCGLELITGGQFNNQIPVLPMASPHQAKKQHQSYQFRRTKLIKDFMGED